jgi:uncharacterized protein YkwD
MIRTTRRALTLMVVTALTALLTTVAPAAPANAAVINSVTLNASEAGLVNYINSARRKAGLKPVIVTSGTTDVARRWARQMSNSKTLKHNPNFATQVRNAGSPKWTRVTENVGYASACNVKQLFDAYMKSPGHRKNIMDPKVRYLGIGSVDRKDPKWSCGILYNTMNFVNQYSSTYGKTRVAPAKLLNY